MTDSQTPPATFLSLQHGELHFPVYLPDATFGFVRTADPADMENVGVEAVVMNTFHLMQHPGSSTIQSLGGLHRMSGWRGPIFTDSGGFQAYSLIRQNPKFGSINDRGLTFQPEGAARKYQLTPEKSVQLQIGYGSDVVICLDDCTHAENSLNEQRLSVRRTIDWARRSRAEFNRLVAQKKLVGEQKPRLFAVVQGGGEHSLRKECADALLEIGFDGFGFGGWPLDGEGNLLEDILGYTRELIPAQFPMHALGVGHPRNVQACWRLGYGIFDSAMPTRDARHGRLYVFNFTGENLPAEGKWLRYCYIEDERHIRQDGPVSPLCDCPVCSRLSLGFLHHVFKRQDGLFQRLATLHNLRFMTRLTELLRKQASA
jgi:queuine tRNA-ribosyltransferase